MWLRKDTLEEFKAICRDEFGVELSDVEAHERAVAVLDLFSLLCLEKPLEDELDADLPAPGTLSVMKEESAGVIPVHQPSGDILVVQHIAGHWGVPKGHLENTETPREAALREFSEEVGITEVTLKERPVVETYVFTKAGKQIEKTVTYFVGYVDSKKVTLNQDELQGYAWLPRAEAEERLTFSKDVLARAEI